MSYMLNDLSSRWRQLPLSRRRILLVSAVADLSLRGWALLDVRSRDSAQVRGDKRVWAVVLTVVNSAGVVPAAYLVLGRGKER